jgi:hypothetical protein
MRTNITWQLLEYEEEASERSKKEDYPHWSNEGRHSDGSEMDAEVVQTPPTRRLSEGSERSPTRRLSEGIERSPTRRLSEGSERSPTLNRVGTPSSSVGEPSPTFSPLQVCVCVCVCVCVRVRSCVCL